MGPSNATSDVTREDVRSLFSQLEQPSVPLSAGEVADKLGGTSQSARQCLEELTDGGELRTRQIAGTTRVWWRATESTSTGQEFEGDAFSAFVNAVEDYAIFMLDRDGIVVNWNEGAERIKGYVEDDIVGEHFSTFYTDDDRDDGVAEGNLETAVTEGRVEDEGWRVRKDGTRFWANVVITAIRNDDGTLEGFTKVTRDMTERRAYELQIRQERDFTEQILETVPISICLLTSDGEFVRANQRLLDKLGIDESDLEGYSADSWEIYDADGELIPADEMPWVSAIKTERPVNDFQCQVDLPEVGRRWLSLDAALIEGESFEETMAVISIDDITDQKERERQLRREYTQTEKLLRTAPIAIAVQNAEGQTVLANQRAQEALGLSERELIDSPEDTDEWGLYDTDDNLLPPTETPSARVLATGKPVFDEELVIDLPNSDRMWFRINAAPVFSADGTIERVITAGEDITELKKRERQLERRKTELETELSEILGRISDAFYALDDEWRFTHLNEYAAEIMQQSIDELLGREVWDVFPEATESIYWERLQAAMNTQEPVTFEVYEAEFDAWLEFNAYPSESGLSIYFRDVTERRTRERELEESERRYRTLIEHFPNGAVALVDADLTYRTVGGTPPDAADATVEEVKGKPVGEILPPTLADELIPRYEAAFDGESSTFELGLDDWFYYFHIAPVRDDAGDVFAALGISQNITERREYERKLKESNERLEQFAYAASHDLQEPLRMISSYLQLTERRYADELDEDGREFIEFAVDGAERMREMIDGLLDYSRVETEGDPFEPVDLNTVLSNVRTDLQIQIEESDAVLTAESLPRVRGDRSQLQQLFLNLVGNAIEYCGDDPPRVHLSAEQINDEWRLSVRDEGIGIDPGDTDRIFEVFQRLHTQDEHAGTGIGLALCRRIVERHGGTIWVESEPGEGTTFSFTLPVSDESGEKTALDQ